MAETVKSDAKLKDGFTVIAHSQGALVFRAYIEQYSGRSGYPSVHNFISAAGPHGGVYGVPGFNRLCPNKHCPFFNWFVNAATKYHLTSGLTQRLFSFAAYWVNPMDRAGYLKENIFLADINNEREPTNSSYREAMIKLNRVLLLYTNDDIIIIPDTSPKFEQFAEGNATEKVPFKESRQYKEDLIGLRTLDEQGTLEVKDMDCQHDLLVAEECAEMLWPLVKGYLK